MLKEITTTADYAGQYVALRSRSDDTVVAAGFDAKQTFDQALQKGAEHPVLVFVPSENSVNIYTCRS